MPGGAMSQQKMLTSENALMLVGAGPVAVADLHQFAPLVDGVVALDGGAEAVLEAGLKPLAVIGDLDSLSSPARAAFGAVLHRVEEQDTTDFEKALARVAAPRLLALGLTAGRLDHGFAALNALARHPRRRIVVLGPEDATVLLPPEGLALDLPPGLRLSLLPMGRAVVTAEGLVWPLEGAVLEPAGAISASNAVGPGGRVRIEAVGPLLVTLERAAVPALWRALAPAR